MITARCSCVRSTAITVLLLAASASCQSPQVAEEVLAAKLSEPTMDSVPREVFLANRQPLIDEIRVARKFFESRAR